MATSGPGPGGSDGQIRYWNSEPGKQWVRYQRGLDACFDGINRRLLDLADVAPGLSILDIGCGTGATCIGMAESFGRQVAITGMDVSRPLLEHARERVARGGYGNITLVEQDLQTYRPGTTRYDRIVSRFGVMFFNDPHLAFRNIVSAMHEQGTLTFVAWSGVDTNPWFRIPRDAAIEVLGEPGATRPREPGPMAFSDLDYLQEIMSGSGLDEFSIDVEPNTIATDLGMDEMVELACNLGPAVRLIREKDGSEADRLRIMKMVKADFAVFQRDNTIEVPVEIVVCRGRRT